MSMGSVKEQLGVVSHINMLGHVEARSVDELWAGKTDVKERRKLQNRLNRRSYSECVSTVCSIL